MLHINMVLIIENLENEIKITKRHIKIMKLIDEQGPLGIIKISKITKIPSQQVRYSLRIIQQCGFLSPTKKGAKLNIKGCNFLKKLNNEKKNFFEKIKNL